MANFTCIFNIANAFILNNKFTSIIRAIKLRSKKVEMNGYIICIQRFINNRMHGKMRGMTLSEVVRRPSNKLIKHAYMNVGVND